MKVGSQPQTFPHAETIANLGKAERAINATPKAEGRASIPPRDQPAAHVEISAEALQQSQSTPIPQVDLKPPRPFIPGTNVAKAYERRHPYANPAPVITLPVEKITKPTGDV